MKFRRAPGAFTLIELLVVIAIIATLIGLSFPAYQSIQNTAKRTQAKNDLVQIVTAVNAYYTEYGKYPTDGGSDVTLGDGTQADLMNALRGLDDTTLNPRKIVFLNPPEVKDSANPHSGVGPAGDGQFYDPWGKPYLIQIDGDYSNEMENPYNRGAGSDPLRAGVIAWSVGKDRATADDDKNIGTAKDDVISWQ